MNILFTLCGRAGSKGVKGKNARDFLDVPLVWYSMAGIKLYMQRYCTSQDIVTIALNTDSEDLIQLVKRVTDLEILVLRRDESLAGDRVPKVAVIQDSLNRAEQQTGYTYDIVVDLDITSPLRTVEDIHNAIDRKISRPEVDVVYSVTHARRNPYFNMVKEEGGTFKTALPSNFVSRQQAPVFYDMNASIYAYSPSALHQKESATFFSSSICDAVLMFDTGILDIDSEEDYYLMQVIAKFLFENKEGYIEVYRQVLNWSQI